MTIALYISLVLNYLFVAGVVLMVICGDKRFSDDSIVFLTLAWPIGVPLLLVKKLLASKEQG